MNFSPLRSLAIYRADLRSLEIGVVDFVPLRDSSSFLCISSVLSSWSNKGEMHI